MANYKSQYTGAQIDEGIGKAGKALVTPDTTPDSPRIVSIATDGTQQDLTLGDGLTIENGVISASGGGGGGVSINTDTMYTINVSGGYFNKDNWIFINFVDADGIYYPVYRTSDAGGDSGKALGFIVTKSIGSPEFDIPSTASLYTAGGVAITSASILNQHINEIIFLTNDFSWYMGN